MNKSFSFLLGLLFALVSVSCTDSSFNKRVEADFQKKQECFSSGDFFKVFQRNDLSSDEREALTFLYAYMPVGDITDYDGDCVAPMLLVRKLHWEKLCPKTCSVISYFRFV